MIKPYWQDKLRTLYNHDCRNMPELADNSIQCCVTSPPYWGLRKYAGEQDLIWGGNNHHEHEWITLATYHGNGGGGVSPEFGTRHNSETWNKIHDTKDRNIYTNTCSLCGAWRGAFGLEPTPELYIQHSIEILREIRRVLRKDGVVFWNLSDSYYSQPAGNKTPNKFMSEVHQSAREDANDPKRINKLPHHDVLKPKDMCLIPERFKIAAQEDGWYIRSTIIWSKNNPMPESVTDRPTESHEYIIMLTKSARYYWDQEAVREIATGYDGRKDTTIKPSDKYADRNHMLDGVNPESIHIREAERWPNQVKLSNTNYGGDGSGFQGHSGYKRADGSLFAPGRNLRSVWEFPTQPYREAHFATFPEELPERCIKAASKEGDVVLDPFSGSGTTMKVAAELNRQAVGYELSKEYCDLIIQRNKQGVLL